MRGHAPRDDGSTACDDGYAARDNGSAVLDNKSAARDDGWQRAMTSPQCPTTGTQHWTKDTGLGNDGCFSGDNG